MNKYILIFIIALCVRLIPFSHVVLNHPEGIYTYDSEGYLLLAQNIQDCHTFSRFCNYPEYPEVIISEANRTPGYPFFLFVLKHIFNSDFFVVLIQILISSGICVMTAYLAKLLLNSNKWYWVIGILICLDVPSVYLSNLILTETLFTAMLLASMLLLLQGLTLSNIFYILFAGLLMGGAILCRPIAVYLPGLIFLYFLIYKRPIKFLFTFLIAGYIVVTPWVIRNNMVFGDLFLSTVSSSNFLYYSAGRVQAEVEGKSLTAVQAEITRGVQKEFGLDYDDSKVPEYTRFYNQRAKEIIMEHPIVFVKQTSISMIYFFIKPLRNGIDILLGYNKRWFNPISGIGHANEKSKLKTFIEETSRITIGLVGYQVIFTGVVTLLIVLGLYHHRSVEVSFLVFLIIYFALASSIVEVDGRMKVPVLPFLYALSGLGLSKCFDKQRIS